MPVPVSGVPERLPMAALRRDPAKRGCGGRVSAHPGCGRRRGVGPEPGGTGLSGGSPGSTRRCPLASPAGAPRPPGLLHGTTGAWPGVARGAGSRGEHKESSPWPGEPPRNEHRGAGEGGGRALSLCSITTLLSQRAAGLLRKDLVCWFWRV